MTTHPDIFTSNAQALVNPVNCVGVMGRGLAAAFRARWPLMHTDYRAACQRHEIRPGRVYVHRIGGGRLVVSFPTKRHWRDHSRIEDISAGLDSLLAAIRGEGITSIAVPALGCGLGGLDWRDVEPLIRGKLSRLDGVAIWVYGPR